MKIIKTAAWVYYLSDAQYQMIVEQQQDIDDYEEILMGKWLIFCGKYEYAENLCKLAIAECGLSEAKHSADFSSGRGVCCFYMLSSDFGTNKRFISYFRDKGLLPKTKKGTYVNLAYKHDFDTVLGKYEKGYKGSIHLDKYIDLISGEWTEYCREKEQQEEKEKKIYEMSVEYTGDRVSNATSHLRGNDSYNSAVVRAAIKNQGKTIKELAGYIDVSDATIRSWLNGKTKPSVGNIMALCLCLGLSPSDVIIRG